MRFSGSTHGREDEDDDGLFGAQIFEGARQYVVFDALGESYGIDLRRVREIAHSISITTVPGTPPFINGIVSLRGQVIPVVDLARKFGQDAGTFDARSAIIVVEVDDRKIGVRAERVQDIVVLRDEDVRPPPKFSSKVRQEFLSGLVNAGDGLFILLDIDRLLSEEELAAVRDVAVRDKVEVPRPGAGT